MRSLAILAILAGVAYLVYTQALPKYQERKEAEQAVDAEIEKSRQCIRLAKSANESFGTEIRQFSQPPIDQGLWANFLLRISGDLSAADRACSCPSEACLSATAALLELREVVNDLNTFIRTASQPVTDAASRLDTVGRLLDQAAKQQG